MLTKRETIRQEALLRCKLSVKNVVDEATKAGMVVDLGREGELYEHWAEIDGVSIRTIDRTKHFGDNIKVSLQVAGNETGCTRTYPVKEGGIVNTSAIIDYIRVMVQRKKDSDISYRNAEKRRKADEKMYERLSKLHAGIGCISVSCEYGRTSIEVYGLSEDQAKNVLALLAPALRPVPEPGEIWQHTRVKVPSQVVSNKGMIKLEAIDDKKNVCTIPKREFAESWELISAAPEVEE